MAVARCPFGRSGYRYPAIGSTLAALLLVGCGQAARGPVRTPGDATQRAVPAVAARTPDESAGRRPLDEPTRVDGRRGPESAVCV